MSLSNRRARERRRNAAQLRDNVLAIVAHDLKQPLSTIVMAAELLADVTDEEKRRHFLDIITAAAHQADFLVHDLLDVERIENAGLQVHCASEPAAYLIESIAATYAELAAKSGKHFVCDVDAVRGSHIWVESPRFVQLLSNLISNAMKFTGPDGSVTVSASETGDNLLVSVTDTGIGINEEELPHVFERFWQANHHHRAGAGLGLAIAKGIAEAHHGRIGVTSKAGVGSTFYFTIPLRKRGADVQEYSGTAGRVAYR